MCLYGNYIMVKVNSTNKSSREVAIDACIAREIQYLNEQGVLTIGCCCSHGDEEYNPHVLYKEESVSIMQRLGYVSEQYHYKGIGFTGIYLAILKTGCHSKLECKVWHESNKIPYEKNLGVLK